MTCFREDIHLHVDAHATQTQDGSSQAQEILIEEVERLLEDVAPNEADTASR